MLYSICHLQPNWRSRLLLLLAVCLLLAACAAPPVVQTQHLASPAPAASPAPTVRSASPTPSKTRLVDMANLQTYHHPTGVFSIDIPASWASDDRSRRNEVLVQFADQHTNGVVLVDISPLAQRQSPQQLTSILTSYLDRKYDPQPNYTRDAAQRQDDGSISISWSYASTVGAAPVQVAGNSFVTQRADKIAVVTLAVPQEQLTILKPIIAQIMKSYRLNPAALPATTPVATPAVLSPAQLTRYNDPDGRFALDVPAGWLLTDQSSADEAFLAWRSAGQPGVVLLNVLNDQPARTADERARLLQAFLRNSFGAQRGFALDTPQTQPDGQVQVTWRYSALVDGQATELAGYSSITDQGGRTALLTIAVPVAQQVAARPAIEQIQRSLVLRLATEGTERTEICSTL